MDCGKIAILIPCYNEEKTIAKVVTEFKSLLPEARVIVYNNNSSDHTVLEAQNAGAEVCQENRQGKGYVVQAMFKAVDADIYILVDGDDTYPADSVFKLLDPVIKNEADMTVGSRISPQSRSEFKFLNLAGNKLYLYIINWIFKTRLSDILSGYRCMTRNLVKSLPLFLPGFEVETEMTIKALERGFRIQEVPVDLRSRPSGSFSKINLVSDGVKIFATIFSLARDYKPLTFFGSIGIIFILAGLVPGFVVINDFMRTGLIFHIPSAILAVGIVLAGLLSIVIGIILHAFNRRIQEVEHSLQMIVNGQKRNSP